MSVDLMEKEALLVAWACETHTPLYRFKSSLFPKLLESFGVKLRTTTEVLKRYYYGLYDTALEWAGSMLSQAPSVAVTCDTWTQNSNVFLRTSCITLLTTSRMFVGSCST